MADVCFDPVQFDGECRDWLRATLRWHKGAFTLDELEAFDDRMNGGCGVKYKIWRNARNRATGPQYTDYLVGRLCEFLDSKEIAFDGPPTPAGAGGGAAVVPIEKV